VAQLVVLKLYGGLMAGESGVLKLKVLPNQPEKRGSRGFGSTGGYSSTEVAKYDPNPQSGEPECNKAKDNI
jgi:hypothetical protein